MYLYFTSKPALGTTLEERLKVNASFQIGLLGSLDVAAPAFFFF